MERDSREVAREAIMKKAAERREETRKLDEEIAKDEAKNGYSKEDALRERINDIRG